MNLHSILDKRKLDFDNVGLHLTLINHKPNFINEYLQ
jgi:hypothetical protein